MEALRDHFEPIIAQQEDDYNDKFCLNTQVQVRNITKDEKLLQTAPILKAIKSQNKTITNAILESNKAIVEAIKSTRTDPSPWGGVNWTPIVQGLATGFAQSLGAQVSFPTTPSPSATTPAAQTPGEVQELRKEIQQLTNTVNTLAQTVSNMSQQPVIPDAIVQLINKQDQRLDRLESMFTQFMQAQIRNGSNNGSNDSGSTPASSTPLAPAAPSVPPAPSGAPPVSPATQGMVQDQAKSTPPEITSAKPYEGVLNTETIVTADLEAIIMPDGSNKIYMAAWYNGKKSKIFDITQYALNSEAMLADLGPGLSQGQGFWLNLINENRGSFLYFHNWAGYDAILSLIPLIGLHEHGLTFDPIIQNNQVISLTAFQEIQGKKKKVLTIKDSLKLIPGALGKLAKDFQVETQKDHFPHYFLLNGDVSKTLLYAGPLPAYEFFEPKRTTLEDYHEMVKEFKEKDWEYLEVSKKYILGDVKAQYQIIIKYFNTLRDTFPINPLGLLSAPGTAFKIWRTVQLPLLNKDSLKVYDLSRSLDPKFRGAYCGGIVDVYRPHLVNQKGFYYDVNSLYPTAMCKPMPVGIPTPTNLTKMDPFFFGYLEATVKAPTPDTPGGYIGLLPIKSGGRVICPGGEFSGFFFSEELRFALANGYQLLDIGEAWIFQRGENLFRTLIEQLNAMKVKSQLEGKPVLRNIAKLLMNSMYGRFGMHTPELKHAIVDPQQLDQIVENYLVLVLGCPKTRALEKRTLGTLDLITYILNKELLDFSKNKDIKLLRKFLRGIPGQTNVPIAAAVTSYSRIIINEFKLLALNLGLDIFYSDTDSLVVNGPLPPEVCHSAEPRSWDSPGPRLGKLKLENTFKEGIFAAPKIYYLELEDGTILTKCKGYSGKLNKSQYLDLLEGHALDLTVTRWVRSLGEGSVQIRKGLKYILNPQFNKRQKVFEDGKWVNTSPRIFNLKERGEK